MHRCELTVVMPVYNEEACIASVVESWCQVLSRLGIDYKMIILNDGSSDSTWAELERFAMRSQVTLINKKNSGHGPTILQGYRLGVTESEWVFQVDSDDEMDSGHFESLWRARESCVALFGFRLGRIQNTGRSLISLFSRLAVTLLFANGVRDVNTPYRLINSKVLSQVIKYIPADTFAPNIIIAGLLAASGQPLLNLPIPHEGRKSGQISIVKLRLWKAAFLSLHQIIGFRLNKYMTALKDVAQCRS